MRLLKFLRRQMAILQSGWNEDKYWQRRMYCQNHNNILSKYFLFYLRRTEARMNASTGLGLGTPESPMCFIDGKIELPHRLNNIIIARNVKIGKNAYFFHGVTITESDKNKITNIGDSVRIGTGAVILNNVTIGDYAQIGANCVVTNDIPRGYALACQAR